MNRLQMVAGDTAGAEDKQEVQAFDFPQGMAGFPGELRFAFLYEGHGDITCLQSIDNPQVAFLLTPWDDQRLGPPPSISDERRDCLHLGDGEQPLWMLVLNPFADPAWVTANLQAPVAINVEARIGLQCIRPEEDLPLRFRWMEQPKQAA